VKTLIVYLILLASISAQLKINIYAPDFTLSDAHEIQHSLSDYHGQFVILYFYPKDNTLGCTKEACSFRDSFSEIRELNATILGVSWDSSKNHASFTEKYSLPFTLLSDIKGKVSKVYDAAGWFMPKRYTYIIDPNGKIVNVYTKFDISTHSAEIISFIKSISKSNPQTISN